jgi:hypothetical protein
MVIRNTLVPVLMLIAKWTAMGSRIQHGYGVVNITNEDGSSLSLPDLTRISSSNNDMRELPNLKDCFFAKATVHPKHSEWKYCVDGSRNTMLQHLARLEALPTKTDEHKKEIRQISESIPRMTALLTDSSMVPVSAAIRNWLRFHKFTVWPNGSRNFVFGASVGRGRRICPRCYQIGHGTCSSCRLDLDENGLDRMASKIAISDAYPIKDNGAWEFRIWGWIPSAGIPPGFKRQGFLDHLKGLFSSPVDWKEALGDVDISLACWREYASVRDDTPVNGSFKDFFKSLLED